MRLSSLLTCLFSATLLTHCTGVLPTMGEQTERQQRYTTDALPIAFQQTRLAAMRTGVTMVAEHPENGTMQGTAYHGHVTVLMLLEAVKDQTRIQVLARTEPGTFSHGALDLASRILAAYEPGTP